MFFFQIIPNTAIVFKDGSDNIDRKIIDKLFHMYFIALQIFDLRYVCGLELAESEPCVVCKINQKYSHAGFDIFIFLHVIPNTAHAGGRTKIA